MANFNSTAATINSNSDEVGREQRLDEIVMRIEQSVEGMLGSNRFIELAPANRNGSDDSTCIQLSATFDTADIDAGQVGLGLMEDDVEYKHIAEQTATRLREFAAWVNKAADSIEAKR